MSVTTGFFVYGKAKVVLIGLGYLEVEIKTGREGVVEIDCYNDETSLLVDITQEAQTIGVIGKSKLDASTIPTSTKLVIPAKITILVPSGTDLQVTHSNVKAQEVQIRNISVILGKNHHVSALNICGALDASLSSNAYLNAVGEFSKITMLSEDDTIVHTNGEVQSYIIDILPGAKVTHEGKIVNSINKNKGGKFIWI
jgi:hypothetical protein